LPIIPKEWQYTTAEKTKKQLNILTDLMNRPDVGTIINACDAGREGELIFRLVYNHSKCRKATQRLWISSMEEAAIREGFRNLRPGEDYDRLYNSALCRGQADWLVGMNLSRMYSLIYNTTLRVGRVQTPTLAMVVEREHKISSFVKEPFYVVELSGIGIKAEREKIKDRTQAESVLAACDGQTAHIDSLKKQEKSVSPPKLYDLTTLQREVNRLFGYTAAQTLSCVQSLYEAKIVTYPRSDSRYITEDMAHSIPEVVESVAEALSLDISANEINVSQIVNSNKVTDHHAIIPTAAITKADISALPAADRDILMMICVRLVAAVGHKHTYCETTVVLICGGEIFTAKGKSVIKNGWKAVEQTFLESIGKGAKESDKTLPTLSETQQFNAQTSLREGFTQPPKHYTEDTLLSAMENAGVEIAQIESEVNSDNADDSIPHTAPKGLGTPATRAATIEGLVKSELITRKGKQILPCEKGASLIKVLPDSVKSPLLTANWENGLSKIEKGELTADDFMLSIGKFVEDTVKTNATASDEHKALFPFTVQRGEAVGKCPRCSESVTETPKAYSCENFRNKTCEFVLWKSNKFFEAKKKTLTKKAAKALLKDGRVFMSGLFSEKTEKTYDATIVLKDEGKGYPKFGLEFDNSKTRKGKGAVKNNKSS
jgi:DNA topoisomerase-3